MSLVPDGTPNLPNLGPELKIVEEPFIETITENKWPNGSRRGGRHGGKAAQDRVMSMA